MLICLCLKQDLKAQTDFLEIWHIAIRDLGL